MAKSKKPKKYEYDRVSTSIPTQPHRLLKSRSSLVGGKIQPWLGFAAETFAQIPGESEEDVLANATFALRLLAWYERVSLKRQTEIRAEMDEMGLKEYDLGKAKEA